MNKCLKCKYHLLSFSGIDKCSRSKTDLGHAVIYENCHIERSKGDGCGKNAEWFEAGLTG
jgi:hypothetical protein